MKLISSFISFFTIAVIAFSSSALAEHEGLDMRILEAKSVFSDFTSVPGRGIPQEILKDANTIIIFPRLYKGGFILGVRFGIGVAVARDEETGKWGSPAFVRISGGSLGYQLGVQKNDLILIGRNGFSLKDFGGGPTMGVTGSMAAGPWGLHSEIGTGWQLNSNMHWFSNNNGLYAGLTTEGTVFSYDQNANWVYYGQGVSPQEILFSKNVKPSAVSQLLIDQITRFEFGGPAPEISVEQPYDGRSQYSQPYTRTSSVNTPSNTYSNNTYSQTGYTGNNSNYQQAQPTKKPHMKSSYEIYYDNARQQEHLTRNSSYYQGQQSYR